MYKRVLLKLSGEAMKGNCGDSIIDHKLLDGLVSVISSLRNEGVEICIVIGAGNIWRGKLASDIGIEPIPADFMGMMGTVINAVALSSALKKVNIPTRVFTAIPNIPEVNEAYDIDKANDALSKGEVCFLAGGTGKPFYTTDTAATMRALELKCDAIFMGKNGVEGVYDSDPKTNPNAKFIKTITYKEMLEQKLKVMDLTAVELIKNSDIEIRVFSMSNPDNFIKVAKGDSLGTTCKKGE